MKQNIVILVIIVVLGLGAYVLYENGGTDIMIGEETAMEKDEGGGMGMMTQVTEETVDYYDGVSGYLAQPSSLGEYPGLILIHEWWGLNDNIRDLAKQFAENGYVALAVDLYEGQVAQNTDEARALAGGVRGDVEGAFENLGAAVSYLQTLPNVVDNQLASVGWCFGGGWSYQMAKNDLGVAASVMYYGQFAPDDDLSMMRATILGHFGEEDRSISVDNVQVFEAKLKTHSGEHQVFIYPHAGHGFANAGDDDYVEDAAELAWTRTLELFDRVFAD